MTVGPVPWLGSTCRSNGQTNTMPRIVRLCATKWTLLWSSNAQNSKHTCYLSPLAYVSPVINGFIIPVLFARNIFIENNADLKTADTFAILPLGEWRAYETFSTYVCLQGRICTMIFTQARGDQISYDNIYFNKTSHVINSAIPLKNLA